MATVLALTAVPLSGEQKRALVREIAQGVQDAFAFPPTLKSIMVIELPEENVCEAARGQTTLLVWSAPGKPVEQKRRLARNLNGAVTRVTGNPGRMKVVVIIKEHPAVNVGVDGFLRADAV